MSARRGKKIETIALTVLIPPIFRLHYLTEEPFSYEETIKLGEYLSCLDKLAFSDNSSYPAFRILLDRNRNFFDNTEYSIFGDKLFDILYNLNEQEISYVLKRVREERTEARKSQMN